MLARRLTKAAREVSDRQYGDRQADLLGGIDQGRAHRNAVVVRATIGLMVKVLKLTDGGESGLHHFKVELGGDRAKVVGRQKVCESIHTDAPCPERILGVGAGHLRKSGQRALKSVRMEVADARNDEAIESYVHTGVGTRLNVANPTSVIQRERAGGEPAFRAGEGVRRRSALICLRQY